MAYNDKVSPSIFGRRFGLQTLSTNQSGAQVGPAPDFLVGPEDLRIATSTAETTASYMKAYGVTLLTSAQTAATGAVMRLDPPIPGVRKQIQILSTATGVASTIAWYITAGDGTGGAVFRGSTWSSSFTVLSSSTPVLINLMGVTTAIWALTNTSASFGGAATTST